MNNLKTNIYVSKKRLHEIPNDVYRRKIQKSKNKKTDMMKNDILNTLTVLRGKSEHNSDLKYNSDQERYVYTENKSGLI